MLARVGAVDNNISHVYVLASQLPGCYSRAVPAGGLPGRMVCGYAPPAISCGTARNRTEQHTAPHQHRTEQNRTEHHTPHHTTPHHTRTEQNRTEQSRRQHISRQRCEISRNSKWCEQSRGLLSITVLTAAL